MDRPTTKKTQVNGIAFVASALLAPGMAAAIFFIIPGLADPSIAPGEIGRLIGSFLFLMVMVSFWGALPSLVFGGLVLAAIQQMPWRGRPGMVVLMMGGVVAAGLYVLTGLGVAGASPPVALFFAPWATDLGAPSANGQDWWLVASLLLAGAAAGLIYGALAKRG